ncbi:hypothetical protein BJ912DRAFT_907398, partial [Pholiota molesta]
MEHQEIAENVRALRDELRDLADFLHRPQAPAPAPTPAPVVVMEGPAPEPQHVQVTDQGVGSSSEISSLRPPGPQIVDIVLSDRAASVSRSTSNASGVSFLSSHHSDDYIFDEIEQEESYLSPQAWRPATIYEESSSSSPDDDSSSSMESSSSISEVSDASERTARPQQPPDILEQSLRAIQDQLQSLAQGQDSTQEAIDALQRREIPPPPQPEDHTSELADRLRHIEELIQTLLAQGHPRGADVYSEAPPVSTRTESISESDDSLERLARILNDMALPPDIPHMPTPMTARTGPTMVQQLEDILSSDNLSPTAPLAPPRVVPFTYQPADRGERIRSTSPVSMDTLPARPITVPIPPYLPLPPRRRQGRSRQQGPPDWDAESIQNLQSPLHVPQPQQTLRDQRGELRDLRDLRDPRDQRDEPRPAPPPSERQRFPGPLPEPILPPGGLYGSSIRAPTAPPNLGEDEARQNPSWYRPGRHDSRRPQRPAAPPAEPTPPSSGAPPVTSQAPAYVPMPPGPTVVQLPPLFDSLMEILRENRLAQLATVEQQRELMRYMRGLNEWLERDVHDRQSEIRGVVARVDQLSNDLRGMQVR